MAKAGNLPNGRKLYTDGNGVPLAGGFVSFFVPGTTDPSVVYADDALTLPQPCPIPLDAAGTCVAFGVGRFREYVVDAVGDVISDSIVTAGTPLTVTEAMRPVLEAATPAAAELLLSGSSGGTAVTSLNINPGDQTLNVAPTANPPTTLASLNVQGTTTTPNAREFLVDLGLTSSVGHGGTAGNDKVTLYAGIDAKPGTSDVWSFNTVLTMEPSSGSYNAQGYELDYNNLNAHRGHSGNLISDFTAPVSVGMSVSGAGSFSSTCGVAVESVGANVQWNRGFASIGTMAICGFQDWTTAPVGMQFDGAYSVAALNLTSVYGNAGAITGTGLFLKNGMSISWQTADKVNVISDDVDVGNNRVIGLSSGNAIAGIILCAPTIPQHSGLGLGTQDNRWGDAFVTNLRLPNATVLSWEANPAVNNGQVGFVYDHVDASDNRVVGSNSAMVFTGATLSPVTAGFDLGTATNTWANVYSTNGIITPSDLRLKEDIDPLGPALAAVESITPIAFSYTADETHARHFGFDAAKIEAQFAPLVSEQNGYKHLRKDDLIAVLWQAVRELSAKVDAADA